MSHLKHPAQLEVSLFLPGMRNVQKPSSPALPPASGRSVIICLLHLKLYQKSACLRQFCVTDKRLVP